MSHLQAVLEELIPAPSGRRGDCFTIDPDRAVEQLGRLQLPRPDFYLLKLIQAGVASGATRVHVKVGWLGVSVQFIPQSPPCDCHNLFHHLLDVVENPHKHLAVGVNAALGRGARVALEQGGRRQLYTHKGCWEESCLPAEGLKIELRRFDLSCPEVALVRQRCLWSKVPVLVNGRPPSALWGEDHLVQSYLFDSQGNNGLRAPGSSRARLPPLLAAHQLGPTIACQAMLGLTRTQHQLARLDFVKDGAVICQQQEDLGIPGLEGVIEAGELPTDLSGFNLSQGTALSERIEQVRGEAVKMRDRYELSRK